MTKRIKKSELHDFVRGFTERNQFRHVKLDGSAVPKEFRGSPDLYLLGIRYSEEPPHEVAEAYVSRAHDPSIGFAAGTLKSPKVVTLTQNPKGDDVRLTISGGGDKKLMIAVSEEVSDEVRRGVTAKIAYVLFEREGRVHGRDFEHWGEGEKIIRDLDRMVTERFF